MTTTVSTPVKIVALAGLALALGLGGLLMLTQKNGGGSGAAVTPPPVVHHTAAPAAAAKAATHAAAPAVHKPVVHKPAVKRPSIHLVSSLPPAVRRALLQRPVAVVAIYSSHDPIDRAVLAEARAGAAAAHAGFVAANVALEPVAAAISTWSATVMDPAVVVLKRPGTVVFTVSGPTDRDTVAQAAAAAQ